MQWLTKAPRELAAELVSSLRVETPVCCGCVAASQTVAQNRYS